MSGRPAARAGAPDGLVQVFALVASNLTSVFGDPFQLTEDSSRT